MKRNRLLALCSLIALTVALLLVGATAGWAVATTWNGYQTVNITLDGEAFVSEPPGILVEGSTFLPVRALAEALGLDVTWDAETVTAHLTAPVVAAAVSQTTEAPVVVTADESMVEPAAETGRATALSEIPATAMPPLPVDRLVARGILAMSGPEWSGVTDAQIDAALVGIDQAALFAEERAKLTVEEWDKQSPINGVSAETMLERRRKEIPEGGKVVLVRDATGLVLTFQPHMPGVSGLQPITDVQATGGAQADQRAASSTVTRIMTEIIRRLRGN